MANGSAWTFDMLYQTSEFNQILYLLNSWTAFKKIARSPAFDVLTLANPAQRKQTFPSPSCQNWATAIGRLTVEKQFARDQLIGSWHPCTNMPDHKLRWTWIILCLPKYETRNPISRPQKTHSRCSRSLILSPELKRNLPADRRLNDLLEHGLDGVVYEGRLGEERVELPQTIPRERSFHRCRCASKPQIASILPTHASLTRKHMARRGGRSHLNKLRNL